MSRAIHLTRFHALNWYGYRDSIPVDGNLLLAGVTGSGKSILMDLIQFVLVGDLRLVKFNQSATGTHSDRSLKGYVLGDTKQEEGGVTQYMRDSAVSYVALEFTWPNRRKAETWGFRIEFASAAESQGKVTPFFIPAALSRGDFLDEEKRPLDYTAFKALAESRTDRDGVRGRLYSTIDEYTRDLQQPTHLNFNYKILRGLLPTAMSFTFLRSFNDFCRQFILSAERLDVNDVRDSYRAFVRYEKDLKELNDQFERLRGIATLFTTHENFRRDASLARYLEAELRHAHAADLLREDEEKLLVLRSACAEEESRLAELDKLIPKRSADLDALKNTIRESPGGALYLELKTRLQQLVGEIARLTETGRTLESALTARVKSAREWVKQLSALPLNLDAKNVQAVERAITTLENGGVPEFTKNFRALSEAAQRAAAEVSRLAEPTQSKLAKIRAELGPLRDEIAALKIGKLPFPTRLLDALNHHLLSGSRELPARHLRELCEVKDGEEHWRPAVEVAFTRKFAVVVSAENYDEAEQIYHQMREEARGESLVNPTKALKLKRPVRAGSLAEKLTTNDKVAEAIISHQFGELMCVERREALRDHDSAITPDGFMARGAFVERTRHYDNHPFIGQRGLKQQLAWKEKQRDELLVEEAKLAPLADDAIAVQQEWSKRFVAPESLAEQLAEARRLPELVEERDRTIARLNTIDRAKFDELTKEQNDLENELRTLAGEQRRLDQSEKRTDFRRLNKSVEERRTTERELLEKFQRVQREVDVSVWLPRLRELRDEVCTRLPAKDVAASEFASRFHTDREKAIEVWGQLRAARETLAMAHPRFDDLPIEAADNAAYEKQLAKLSDSDIPDYTAKAERERKTWEKLFRTQVLEKLRNALFEVENTRVLLNNSLKRPIGNNRYRVIKWENPDFALYHKLLDASAVAREDELFFASADAELRDACDQFLQSLIDEDKKALADRLLDYRHYYEYDMEVEDLGDDGEVKATSRVDRQSGKFSGGENQSPYFIAILASYLRAYKRHDTRTKQPSLALVPIDEAFSKLSGERIKDCIEAMKSLDLQGVFSMSTGNIPYAFEHCDSLVVVAKEEKRVGKRTQVRNVPVSMHKDSPDARRLLGIE
ncbi:MAG: SbcC/MukB-like Walker B domain-containing protein [Chthoniobacteraceae bacterium]